MGTIELKNKIIQQIETLDNNTLIRVANLIDEFSKEIIAYDVSGNPLDIASYNKMIDEALEDIKHGRVTSHEDLLKEIQDWKNEL
jgi:hypothetical protein